LEEAGGGPFDRFAHTTNFFPWYDDDDDDMPSISKEFQDIEKLAEDGKNWTVFAARVKFAAIAMDVKELLTADVPENADVDTMKAAAQLLNAIIQKLPNSLMIKYIDEEKPYILWSGLEVEFSKPNITQVANIEAHMFGRKSGHNVRQYIDEMLADEGELACAGTKINKKHFRDAIIVSAQHAGTHYIAVLESLINAYEVNRNPDNLTSTILITKLRSTYDSIQATSHSSSSTQANYASRGQNNSRGQGNGRGRGRGGGRNGQRNTDSKQADGNTDGKHSKNMTCFTCGGKGHRSSECPSNSTPGMERNSNRPKRNQANTADSTTSKKKNKKIDSAGTTATQANSAKIVEINAYTASAGGAYTAEAPTGRYIFDSGASEHMTPHRHLLTEYKAIALIPINAANNSSFNAVGCGYLSIEVPNGHGKTRLKLKDVLYAPGMHATLVSLGKLNAAGFSSTISGNTLHLKRAGRTYATIPRKASLYSTGAYLAQAPAEPTVIKLTLDQLHCHLGHQNHKAILKMYTDGHLPDIKLTSRDISECRNCLLSKAAHAPIAAKWTSLLAAKFGDHIHLDIWGPATVRSILEHAHYVLIIMDDATRWAEAPVMQHKLDVFAKYVAWEARKELHSNVHVKINQSDRGGEFLSNDWETYLQQKGTIRKLTVHDTPEHNGVAERFWRTIFNRVHTLLSASGLPRHLWAEALRWAVWIYNRSPHAMLEGTSPFKKRYSSPPDLSRAWEWGTWVYVHCPAGKLETYASEGWWIGLDDTSNGHRIYWSD
jgi:transposase InsO family protein